MPNPAQSYLAEVRDQYEDYPYPKRDPEEEKKRLFTPYYDALDLVNYYCFEGKQSFRDHFRVLVAGGGTGDAAIYLAEQLRDTNAEVVYVDISTASMAIAKERATIRGLTNIRWIHQSLLEVGNLDIGTFDYINCCGVLHHLADPSAGLKALSGVLKEDGAMNIMVYAQYGRTAVYPVQTLMRILSQHIESKQEKVELCKDVLGQLPQKGYFSSLHRDAAAIKSYGDIGIYDTFLHSQDRAYTIPELYEWIEGNGLHLSDIVYGRGDGKTLYHPGAYVKDPELLRKISTFPLRKQQAIAELLIGGIPTHTCYVTKRPKLKPQPNDLENVPFLSTNLAAPGIYEVLYRHLSGQNPAAQNGKIFIQRSDAAVTVALTANSHTVEFFRYMDGSSSVGDIIAHLFAKGALPVCEEPYAELLRQFVQLFYELNTYDWLLLRHKSVPAFKLKAELQAPVSTKYAQKASAV